MTTNLFRNVDTLREGPSYQSRIAIAKTRFTVSFPSVLRMFIASILAFAGSAKFVHFIQAGGLPSLGLAVAEIGIAGWILSAYRTRTSAIIAAAASLLFLVRNSVLIYMGRFTCECFGPLVVGMGFAMVINVSLLTASMAIALTTMNSNLKNVSIRQGGWIGVLFAGGLLGFGLQQSGRYQDWYVGQLVGRPMPEALAAVIDQSDSQQELTVVILSMHCSECIELYPRLFNLAVRESRRRDGERIRVIYAIRPGYGVPLATKPGSASERIDIAVDPSIIRQGFPRGYVMYPSAIRVRNGVVVEFIDRKTVVGEWLTTIEERML